MATSETLAITVWDCGFISPQDYEGTHECDDRDVCSGENIAVATRPTCPGCDGPLRIVPTLIMTGRDRGKNSWSASCKNPDCRRDGIEASDSWAYERSKQ